MEEKEGLRIDKYLWHTRLYLSRSLATQACQQGLIRVNFRPVKASRLIHPDTEFTLETEGGTRTFRCLALPSERTSPKGVSTFLEELTPEAERECIIARISASRRSIAAPWALPSNRGIRLIASYLA